MVSPFLPFEQCVIVNWLGYPNLFSDLEANALRCLPLFGQVPSELSARTIPNDTHSVIVSGN